MEVDSTVRSTGKRFLDQPEAAPRGKTAHICNERRCLECLHEDPILLVLLREDRGEAVCCSCYERQISPARD